MSEPCPECGKQIREIRKTTPICKAYEDEYGRLWIGSECDVTIIHTDGTQCTPV